MLERKLGQLQPLAFPVVIAEHFGIGVDDELAPVLMSLLLGDELLVCSKTNAETTTN